ncbi:MAG: sodium ion-translocating decarboxylase subunit beta [Clostridia bacterium]|nr:sodium ion-translocating decarboxylase subunit beta [Clostridia bacterium]
MALLTNLCDGMGESIVTSLNNLWESTGIYDLVANFTTYGWQNLVMVLIACVLFYLAIVKKFEPLLLLPIAFGMFIVNVPGVYHVLFGTKGYVITETATNRDVAIGTLEELRELFARPDATIEQIAELVKDGCEVAGRSYTAMTISSEQVIRDFGLFYYIYKGVDWVIFPPIIFLGIGAMTDFGPLIANPKSMIIGAAAQLGIFITYFGALCIFNFTEAEAAAIAIIGGADGPTAIYVTKKLAEHLLPAIAISAYSYMALIPIIQKPIMRALTTKEERKIKMKQLRKVSKFEKIAFPIIVSFIVGLLLPDAMPLLGMLMLGNLLKESGVCGRLVDTAQGGLMNTVTIFLGVMVGSKATGSLFLSVQTLGIICLGLFAFCMGTVGGLLVAKLMCKLTHGQINPLIGSAGVSAVPMAARISQDVGRESDPDNHLLMHAMGPNVAGVIGSAIAAGVLLALFG